MPGYVLSALYSILFNHPGAVRSISIITNRESEAQRGYMPGVSQLRDGALISKGVGASRPEKESGEQIQLAGKGVWCLGWCLWGSEAHGPSSQSPNEPGPIISNLSGSARTEARETVQQRP